MALTVSGHYVWADRAPTAADDHESFGYVRGMQWINTGTNTVYLCRSVAKDAAVWSAYTGVEILHASEAAAPAVTDDEVAGYSVGSLWVDTDADENYICVDPAEGAAIWQKFPTSTDAATLADAILDGDFAGTHAGTMHRTAADTYAVRRDNSAASAPAVTNDVSEGYAVFSRWLDTTGPDIYECVDATDGAAVWVAVYSAP
jgi:hypothetical protein